MSEKKKILKNSSVFMISQLVTLAFRFLSKPIMIKYIGEEMLGISGALVSILQTLSLAELGFHAAVVYRLYKPLAENDFKACNEYMMVLKRCYQLIASFIGVFTLALAPFIKYFLKDVELNAYIYAVYFVLGFSTAISYLFADKLQLLYADKKDYLAKKIEIILNISLMTVELFVVVKTQNYLFYIILASCRGLLTNIITFICTKRMYPWLKKCKINKEYLKEVMGDVKNLAVANFAGYVYFCTDNLVVSSFVGAVAVTYLSNYTSITSSLRNIADLGIRQIEPFIGHIYAENKSTEKNYPYFMMDTFARFVIAGMLIIPSFVLIDDFVAWWIGDRFVMPSLFLVLLCLDFYLFIVHRACSDYIAITGSYNYEKKISAMGAIINLSTSLVLVQFMGIEGVLIGTVISEIFYWGTRGYVVFRKIFSVTNEQILKYCLKNVCYFITIIFTIVLCKYIVTLFSVSIFLIDFAIKGVIIEIVFMTTVYVIFRKTTELVKVKNMMKR